MYHDFNYETTLASSLRAQWQLDDVLRHDQNLDFSRNFMPESLARTAVLDERSTRPNSASSIRSARTNICRSSGSSRNSSSPSSLDHARPQLRDDDWRVRALLNFAGEEAKHIHLFKRFHAAFVRGFPVECQVIGPSEEIGAEVLRHDPLAVGLVILMIEWMTQQHYLGSIRDDGDLDPLFKSLMKHHWMEEAQHAKLDTLIVEALAEGRTEEQIDRAIDEFFEIGAFLDDGLNTQAGFNLDALEKAIGRKRRQPRRDPRPAAPGRALDLHRLRHGPRALHGDLEALSPNAAPAHRRSRPAVRLNPPNLQGE